MTTRHLYLLRHAKSDWSDDSLPDDQRPLAPRGHRAAAAMQAHFAEAGLAVDAVLCSPALRARETWAEVADGIHGVRVTRFVSDIYEASPQTLLEVVRSVDGADESAMVIGHNPGMEEFARGLSDDAAQRLADGMPTCALVTLSFDGGWRDLDWGGARLDGYVRPRDL